MGGGLEGRVAEHPWRRVAQEAEQAESSYPTAGVSEDLEDVVWI